MICVKCTAFCDLRADLRIRLATLSQVRAQVLVCKLALTCIGLRCQCPEQYEKRTYFSPLENELCFFNVSAIQLSQVSKIWKSVDDETTAKERKAF